MAAFKLEQVLEADDRGLVLILIDADKSPACVLAPKLLGWASRADAR